jgi:virginiamycin B lyase
VNVETIVVARPEDDLLGVAATDDGAVWFTMTAGRVGSVRPDGEVAILDLGEAATPTGVTAATESTVWVVDSTGGRLLYIGADLTVVQETTVPTPDAHPLAAVTLPDGTTWFTEQFGQALGRIGILGRVEEFPVGADGGPSGITASGENVWFSLQGHRPALGHIRGGDAAIELVELPLGSGPLGVEVVDDGAVWTALHAADALARVARDRTVAVIPLDEGASPWAVVSDGGGGVWASLWGADALVRVTVSGEIERVELPAGPRGLAVAPDGTLWASLVSGALARVSSGGVSAAHPAETQ